MGLCIYYRAFWGLEFGTIRKAGNGVAVCAELGVLRVKRRTESASAGVCLAKKIEVPSQSLILIGNQTIIYNLTAAMNGVRQII